MNVDQFARIAKDLLKNDYDCVIAVTSIYEGEGKSTLAKQLDMRIDHDFKLEKNVLFNPTVDQMKQLILTLPRYSVIDADEAIKVLYKLKWADKMQIFLNQLYALSRSRNLATILCMPRYRDFGEFFRNHKIRFWIHIVERGTAIIMSKSWNAFVKDPWYLDENEKIIEQYIVKRKIYNFSIQDKLKAFGKCKNVIGILEFEDLPLPLQEEYKALRDKYKFDDVGIETKVTYQSLKLNEMAKTIINEKSYLIKNHKITRDAVEVAFPGISQQDARRLKILVEHPEELNIGYGNTITILNKPKEEKEVKIEAN